MATRNDSIRRRRVRSLRTTRGGAPGLTLWERWRASAIAVAALIAVALTLGACGSDDPTPTAQPVATMPAEDQPASQSRADDPLAEPEHHWRVRTESADLDIILATPDLAPGERRFAVVIVDNNGVVPLPFVRLTSYRYDGTPDAPGVKPDATESVHSQFHPFPYGGRGIHVAELTFSEPGTWGVEARVPRATGDVEQVEVLFPVGDETASVDLGERPPRVENRTLASVADIKELTTGSMHNPDLYQTTVPEAMDNGKPTVVVFASPAFCTNAVCGPQVEVLTNISTAYGDVADYIHVDLFENPQEIQGDLTRARLTPLLEEWGLVSQEWTFVLDKMGVVTGRFENFAPQTELEAALDAALGAS